jgi:glucose/mannose-6-phosphate isomerase
MKPTSILDSRTEMANLDKSNALGSIEMLGSQVQQIWEISQNITVDPSYKEIENVVVAGMGGSALGTHVIQTVFKEEMKVPVMIAPDYTVPNFVNEKTLVIASSYSGTTEETLAAAEDAKKKGAKVAGITSGGKLAEFLKANNYPSLVFEPKFNPCQQPRMALGYSVFGQIALFARTGVLSIQESDYQGVLNSIAKQHLLNGADALQDKNMAKLLAFEMFSRIPIIVSAEHLEGSSHVFANQLNENAKTYSEFRVIPEMNHHLMEGLRFPESNDGNLFFLLMESDLYNTHNSKRMDLTTQVLDKNHITYKTHKLTSATKLTQAFEMIVLGAYTNYYLAMLNNLDPSPIPWVDWFKSELKK